MGLHDEWMAIIGQRLTDRFPHVPVPGSKDLPCHRCDAMVRLAPSSLTQIALHPDRARVTCIECAVELAKAHGKPIDIEPYTAEAIQERCEALGAPIVTNHVLFEGRAICGTMQGVPRDWPLGHIWIAFNDPQLPSLIAATRDPEHPLHAVMRFEMCPSCMEVYRNA